MLVRVDEPDRTPRVWASWAAADGPQGLAAGLDAVWVLPGEGGQLLEIDPAPYQYTVDQLEAQLKASKANVEQAQAGAQAADANVTKAKDGVTQGVTGFCDEDLTKAAVACLELDGKKCRAYAEKFSWKAAAEEFLRNMVLARQSTQGETDTLVRA